VTQAIGIVRFVADDRFALWQAGDLADDLGWEQRLPDGSPLPENHPDFVPMRVLQLHRDGQEIALTDPFARGLVERVEP
jgi:hypothetical protein